MANPKDASRTSATTSGDRKYPNATWVPPVKPPLKSGMLQNRKFDLHKTKRVAPGHRRP